MATDLIVPQGGSLAVPGRGFEGIKTDRADLLIPRAELLQSTSPKVVEGVLEGAKPGVIVNSLMPSTDGQRVTPLPSRFVPIFCYKRWMRFNPRKRDADGFDPAYEPGAMIWQSSDPNDPRVQSDETKFGPNGEPPLAVTFFNFFSLFPSVPMPVVVGFAKTSYRPGKHLYSLSRFCGGDMWSRAYLLGAFLKNDDKGTYYIFTVNPVGESTPEERQQAEAWWSMFSEKAAELKVHEEEQPDEGTQPF